MKDNLSTKNNRKVKALCVSLTFSGKPISSNASLAHCFCDLQVADTNTYSPFFLRRGCSARALLPCSPKQPHIPSALNPKSGYIPVFSASC